MIGMIAAAGGMGLLSYYTASQSNKVANARAAAANANNIAAANQARAEAEANNLTRQTELLRRFKIRAGKIKDSNQLVGQATALQLTNLDMEILKAHSVTDNAIASRHIEGRLSERLQNSIDIQKSMTSGNIVQGAQSQVRDINSKLEAMTSDLESKQLNVQIDFNNAINQANNNEIRGITYSSSTGTLGAISSGISGAASGAMLASSFSRMGSASSSATTAQNIYNINYGGLM